LDQIMPNHIAAKGIQQFCIYAFSFIMTRQ
jgi:hypothetical protein